MTYSCAEFEADHTVRGYLQREVGLICSVSLKATCIAVSDSKNRVGVKSLSGRYCNYDDMKELFTIARCHMLIISL